MSEMPQDPWEGMSRRDFVKLLGASMALAGATGCVREPSEPILPFAHAPQSGRPGVNRHYATAMMQDGFATGLLVTARDGRPIKIEGNPLHPASLGASNALQQAALLQLYDPHRARSCTHRGGDVSWSEVARAWSLDAVRQRCGTRGAGLCLVLEPTSSLLTATLLDALRDALPDLRLVFHSPAPDNSAVAMQAAFGAALIPRFDMRQASVIVTLDADPFATGPGHLRYARDFGARRRSADEVAIHAAESSPSCTGTLARHRLAVSPIRLELLARELVRRVAPDRPPQDAGTLSQSESVWLARAAAALMAARGSSVVVAGESASPATHIAAAVLNDALHNTNHTVWYNRSPVYRLGETSHDASKLESALTGGDISGIVIGANLVYDLAYNPSIAARLARIPSCYLGEYHDETASVAEWLVPAAHFLESWDAARAWDGTISPVQPMLDPIFGGRSLHHLLAAMVGESRTPRALLQAIHPDAMTDEALRAGLVEGSAFPPVTPVLRHDAWASFAPVQTLHASTGIELQLARSRVLSDGRFAGNAWLQELPDPITKLTWGNALELSPTTASRFKLGTGDVASLRSGSRQLTVPVVVVPGHADDCGTLALGYGRNGPGILEEMIGVNAHLLRATPESISVQCEVVPAALKQALAITQEHWSIEGRSGDITTGTHRAEPGAMPLYQGAAPSHDGFARDQWAMTIDLDLCTGCSACVVACQAENNIPVVGRSGVMQRREMHWIRIDRYLDAATDQGGVVSQPMLCQHCENAPCEYVCPVNATVHSDDGLNEMVYNRCVGTRFCSNNCPYKVRRFNWLNYHQHFTPIDELLQNPDVTVRARGVMEKCTFCVQRVRQAQQQSEVEGSDHTGPVITACQQSCPTGAIIFGSLTRETDPVVASFRDPRAFAALASHNTSPRVRYLSRSGDQSS